MNDTERHETRNAGTSQSRLHFNAKSFIKKRIPILTWMPQYTIAKFLQDILAGITVGLTEIPQGIAYAVVAGLDPQYGLYSGFMGCFMYALFGSCKDVNIGPTAIMATMVQPHVFKLGPDICVLLTFLSGSIIFILGVLHLGFLIEFISYPVTAGFTTAAALQIASTQLNGLFGIPGKSNEFLEAIKKFIENLSQTRLWDALLGVLSMFVLIGMRELKRFGGLKNNPQWSRRRNILGKIAWLLFLARNALIVIFGTTLAYIFYEDGGQKPFKLTENVGKGFPTFEPPPFETTYNGTYYDFSEMTSDLGTTIAFAPLVALLECVAIAKAFSKGKVLDATQEMLALGMSNIMGSFVKSMPVTGSFTRTAVNNSSGVQTQFGGVITGLLVLLSLGLLTQVFYFIPKATLAAVVISSMIYLLEFEALIKIWKTRKLDLLPFFATLFTSLFWSLEYGILVGVLLNITFVLYSSSRPKIDFQKEKLPQGIVYVVTPCKELHYTSADFVRGKIMVECTEENATIVLDGKYITSLDSTVAKNMSELVDDVNSRKQNLIFTNFSQSMIDLCVGTNKKLCSLFRDGLLEDIIDDPTLSRHSPDVIYSIQ